MPEEPLVLDATIEGAINFRAVGPLPCAGGATLAPGRLFRSGMTHRIGPAGLRRLAGEHGIRSVIDLRTDEERQRFGVAPFADAGIALHTLPMEDPADREAAFRQEKVRAFRAGTWDWVAVYRRMVGTSRDSLARALALIAGEAELPAVIHCAAGRDRTGITVALVLAALGVPRERIADDYARSGAYLVAQVDAFLPKGAPHFPLSRAEMERVLSTDRQDILGFLAAEEAAHGSLDALLTAVGLDPPARSRLRARLCAPA